MHTHGELSDTIFLSFSDSAKLFDKTIDQLTMIYDSLVFFLLLLQVVFLVELIRNRADGISLPTASR